MEYELSTARLLALYGESAYYEMGTECWNVAHGHWSYGRSSHRSLKTAFLDATDPKSALTRYQREYEVHKIRRQLLLLHKAQLLTP